MALDELRHRESLRALTSPRRRRRRYLARLTLREDWGLGGGNDGERQERERPSIRAHAPLISLFKLRCAWQSRYLTRLVVRGLHCVVPCADRSAVEELDDSQVSRRDIDNCPDAEALSLWPLSTPSTPLPIDKLSSIRTSRFEFRGHKPLFRPKHVIPCASFRG